MDVSNTNNAWVANGVLGPYTAAKIGVYKCPADNYLSRAQSQAGFSQRNRSLSMNSIFGRFSISTDANVDPTVGGLDWGFRRYRQYLKQPQVRKPSKTWLVLDEHPDSINDGFFINNPTASAWQDIPPPTIVERADSPSRMGTRRSKSGGAQRPSTPCNTIIQPPSPLMRWVGPTLRGTWNAPDTSTSLLALPTSVINRTVPNFPTKGLWQSCDFVEVGDIRLA